MYRLVRIPFLIFLVATGLQAFKMKQAIQTMQDVAEKMENKATGADIHENEIVYEKVEFDNSEIELAYLQTNLHDIYQQDQQETFDQELTKVKEENKMIASQYDAALTQLKKEHKSMVDDLKSELRQLKENIQKMAIELDACKKVDNEDQKNVANQNKTEELSTDKTEDPLCNSVSLSSLPQCLNYKVLNDSTRNSRNYTGLFELSVVSDRSKARNTSPDWHGPGWYRMMSPAGNKIANSKVQKYHCGTHSPGWMNDTHPESGETKDSKVCFHWGQDVCRWSTNIQVTNCGSFYVYNLPKTPGGSFRYCSTFI